MFNATWTSSLRRLVVIAVTGLFTCWMFSLQAQAQVSEELYDDGGIELAPGETIVKSIDGESGMPVPMFNAQTNQPIVGSSVAEHDHGHAPHGHALHGQGPAHHGHAHPHHGGDCGCNQCAGGSIGLGCFGGCEPGCYGRIEALFMRREGDRGVTLSRDFALGEFDHEWGTRLTFGRTFDCVEGCEIAFTGGLSWDLADQRGSRTGPLPVPLLESYLVAGDPPTALDPSISTFTNDRFQRQTYEADYNSFEANRTYAGWDVVRLLYGVRYIDYSEEYLYSVTNAANQNGFLRSDVDNNLIGGQVGLDLGYPLGERIWSMLRARGGVFANFSDGTMQVANNGVNVVANQDEATDLAGLLEFGGSVRYQFTEALSFSAGYELWYLANVASAPDQLSAFVSPGLGANINVGEDIFFHGAVFGAELNF